MIADGQVKATGNTSRLLEDLAWHILPPGICFIFLLRWYPYWNSYWIYSDEGFNLMKALLVTRGYALYSQIWSDQPPLFTQLLAVLFRINGPGVYASRMLVLIFSCLMVWAIVQFLRLAWGDLAALFGVFLLLLLPVFISLSAAVQVGQPSLAMAAVSLLALAAWHRRRKRVFLILSALALGASILIKLFTAFLAPIFVAGLLASEIIISGKSSKWLSRISPALIWFFVFSGCALFGWLLMAGPGSLVQLVGTPLAASQATEYPPNQQLYPITYYLKDAWAILLFAALGVFYLMRGKRWLMLYSLAWMVAAFISLLNLKPVWFHHQLLVTLPAAMLAAGAGEETYRLAVNAIRRRPVARYSWIWLVGGLVAVLLVLLSRTPDVVNTLSAQAIPGEERNAFEDKVLRKIEQYTSKTNWIVTDLPMYPFRVGKLVPPNLAVISWKRFAAGDLDETEIVDTVKEYQPEQILLGRFEFPALEPYLQERYVLILERPDELELYIRKDLLK